MEWPSVIQVVSCGLPRTLSHRYHPLLLLQNHATVETATWGLKSVLALEPPLAVVVELVHGLKRLASLERLLVLKVEGVLRHSPAIHQVLSSWCVWWSSLGKCLEAGIIVQHRGYVAQGSQVIVYHLSLSLRGCIVHKFKLYSWTAFSTGSILQPGRLWLAAIMKRLCCSHVIAVGVAY